MDSPLKLGELADAIGFQTDGASQYLNTRTGEIVMVSDEELSAAEEGDDLEDYPDWQQESIEMARRIVEDTADEFIELPTQFEIHEYSIMEKFCLSVADPEISDALYYAIKGRGAFRRFKDGIYRYGLEEDWYRYRDEALKKIAIAWCEQNNIPYT